MPLEDLFPPLPGQQPAARPADDQMARVREQFFGGMRETAPSLDIAPPELPEPEGFWQGAARYAGQSLPMVGQGAAIAGGLSLAAPALPVLGVAALAGAIPAALMAGSPQDRLTRAGTYGAAGSLGSLAGGILARYATPRVAAAVEGRHFAKLAERATRYGSETLGRNVAYVAAPYGEVAARRAAGQDVAFPELKDTPRNVVIRMAEDVGLDLVFKGARRSVGMLRPPRTTRPEVAAADPVRAEADMMADAELPVLERVDLDAAIPAMPSFWWQRSTRQILADVKRISGRAVGMPEYLVDAPTYNRMRRNLTQLAEAGQAGKYWYEDSAEAILDAVGGDKNQAMLLAKVVARTSANNTLPGNVTAAIKAWNQYISGKPIQFGTGADNAAVEQIFRTGTWKGTKTNSFYLNMAQHIDPVRLEMEVGPGVVDSAATMDLWMFRMFGYDVATQKRTSMTPARYEWMRGETNWMSENLTQMTGESWSPSQVQAALWTTFRALGEDLDVPTQTSIVQHAGRQLPNRFLPTEANLAATNMHFGSFFKERLAQVTHQSRPGASTGLFQDFDTWSPQEQGEFHSQVLRAADMEGLFREFGVIGHGDTGFGLAMAVRPAESKTQALAPHSLELLNKLALASAYITRADQAEWHAPTHAGKNLAQRNAVRLVPNRELTYTEVKTLQGMLESQLGANSIDIHRRHDGYVLLHNGADHAAFQKQFQRHLTAPWLDGSARVGFVPHAAERSRTSLNWADEGGTRGLLDRSLGAGDGRLLRLVHSRAAAVSGVHQHWQDRRRAPDVTAEQFPPDPNQLEMNLGPGGTPLPPIPQLGRRGERDPIQDPGHSAWVTGGIHHPSQGLVSHFHYPERVYSSSGYATDLTNGSQVLFGNPSAPMRVFDLHQTLTRAEGEKLVRLEPMFEITEALRDMVESAGGSFGGISLDPGYFSHPLNNYMGKGAEAIQLTVNPLAIIKHALLRDAAGALPKGDKGTGKQDIFDFIASQMTIAAAKDLPRAVGKTADYYPAHGQLPFGAKVEAPDQPLQVKPGLSRGSTETTFIPHVARNHMFRARSAIANGLRDSDPAEWQQLLDLVKTWDDEVGGMQRRVETSVFPTDPKFSTAQYEQANLIPDVLGGQGQKRQAFNTPAGAFRRRDAFTQGQLGQDPGWANYLGSGHHYGMEDIATKSWVEWFGANATVEKLPGGGRFTLGSLPKGYMSALAHSVIQNDLIPLYRMDYAGLARIYADFGPRLATALHQARGGKTQFTSKRPLDVSIFFEEGTNGKNIGPYSTVDPQMSRQFLMNPLTQIQAIVAAYHPIINKQLGLSISPETHVAHAMAATYFHEMAHFFALGHDAPAGLGWPTQRKVNDFQQELLDNYVDGFHVYESLVGALEHELAQNPNLIGNTLGVARKMKSVGLMNPL